MNSGTVYSKVYYIIYWHYRYIYIHLLPAHLGIPMSPHTCTRTHLQESSAVKEADYPEEEEEIDL